MTNAEKFIEVMNVTFGAGFTLDNLVRECSPCGSLKICDMGCDTFTCDGCRKWWNKEFTAIPEQNLPLTLEDLRWMDGEPVFLDFGDGGEWAVVRIRQEKICLTLKNTICLCHLHCGRVLQAKRMCARTAADSVAILPRLW